MTRARYAIQDDDSPDLAWSACENHKPGRIPDGMTVMVAHASQSFSKLHLEADPNIWSAILRRRVEEFWGISAEAFLCQHPHRWRFARVLKKTSPDGLPDGWVFAGDLLESSRVESAWLAGRNSVAGIR